jgi:hypothetical protein
MSYIKNKLLSYVIKRSIEHPGFYGYIKKRYFISSLIFLIFLPFKCKLSESVIVSGNSNKRFFRPASLCKYQYWGVPIKKSKNYGLNISRLYLATFLYCFVSRKFAFFFRDTINYYRRIVKSSGLNYIFLHSDGLPLARAMILCFKPLGIKFVCVQHGVFHSALDNEIDGIKCNYNVIMNKSQAIFFESSGCLNNLDYSEIETNKKINTVKNNIENIVLIGEGFFTISNEKNKLLLNLYKNLANSVESSGLKCFYRFHPSEKKSISAMFYIICKFNRVVFRKDPGKSVYIGTHSSYMHKMYQNGNVVYQLDLSFYGFDQKVKGAWPVLCLKELTKEIHRISLGDIVYKHASVSKNNSFYEDYDVCSILKEIEENDL